MDWRDVACIVFACTAVNHLGLVAAVERVIRHRLYVVNCPKCLTFWSMMACGVADENSSLFTLHSGCSRYPSFALTLPSGLN